MFFFCLRIFNNSFVYCLSCAPRKAFVYNTYYITSQKSITFSMSYHILFPSYSCEYKIFFSANPLCTYIQALVTGVMFIVYYGLTDNFLRRPTNLISMRFIYFLNYDLYLPIMHLKLISYNAFRCSELFFYTVL